MQWNKVKTVLISLLLIVNIFLAFNLAYLNYKNNKEVDLLKQNVNTIMSQNNIILSDGIDIFSNTTLDSYQFESSSKKQNEISIALIGDYNERSLGAGNLAYDSEKGTITWGTNLNFNIVLNYIPFEYSEDSFTENAMNFLNACGFQLDTQTNVTDGQRTTFYKTLDGISFYDCYITMEFTNSSCYITGLWPITNDYTQLFFEDNSYLVLDILIAFANKCDDISYIYEIEPSYYISESSSESYKILPSYKITTDNGIFFMDMSKNILNA